jgi:hypothetical protein
LPLLVARVSTDHINLTVPPDNLAFIADAADAGANFHGDSSLPKRDYLPDYGETEHVMAGKRGGKGIADF